VQRKGEIIVYVGEKAEEGLPKDAANRYENEPQASGSNYPSGLIVVGMDVDKASLTSR
jgi:hypothetical protein